MMCTDYPSLYPIALRPLRASRDIELFVRQGYRGDNDQQLDDWDERGKRWLHSEVGECEWSAWMDG